MSDGEKVCPSCTGPIEFSHEDDVGQKFWKCQKCGKQTSKPVTKEEPTDNNEEKHEEPEAPEYMCGQCAYFRTPKCPWIDDIKKGLIDKSSAACGDFYPKKKGKSTSKGKGSQADTLVQLCLAKNPELFYDQHRVPYARVERDGVKQNMAIKSKRFKTWLAKLLYDQTKKSTQQRNFEFNAQCVAGHSLVRRPRVQVIQSRCSG